ncbi:PREDICTED: hemoglobin subunit alpha-3-like [Nanorana parkeri]|uniref:hemoglobin subunit alpha-3-like n=1 Tax=Nanorana parkeri TaxID=125878 RepID=UPI000855094A|nr:PREDICTED: hemoglobin subunit alpha-3-like [Nanorana parkeri]
MTFSDAEKAAIVSIWGKVSGNENSLGAEALERLFLSFPQTKTYFNHFDLSHGSADLQRHGGKVLGALGEAAKHLDNIEGALAKISDLHAYNLRVDPGNFEAPSPSPEEAFIGERLQDKTIHQHSEHLNCASARPKVLCVRSEKLSDVRMGLGGGDTAMEKKLTKKISASLLICLRAVNAEILDHGYYGSPAALELQVP